jgi:pyrrolidone-carboxylate peptidase
LTSISSRPLFQSLTHHIRLIETTTTTHTPHHPPPLILHPNLPNQHHPNNPKMRSFIAIAALVALATASAPAPAKTITVTEDVTVTSCEAVVTDCAAWEDAPADETSSIVTATWEDAPVEPSSAATYWSDAPVAPSSTLVSSWVDVTSTPVAVVSSTGTWVCSHFPTTSHFT